MKIALVHDYLSQNGGAEQVLKVLHQMFPEAPIFVLFADRDNVDPAFRDADIRESWLAYLPFSRRHYQWYLPLMGAATESHDLSEFDVVISSVSAFAKGIITAPTTTHICYCHTPTRYLWSDAHTYLENLPRNPLIKMFLPRLLSHLRLWDRQAADRVDFFVANSETVRQRIRKYYQRESEVIYPPVDTARFSLSANEPRDFYLTGGRLVNYKHFDWVIDACNRLQKPLKIFGDGVAEKNLRAMAGPTVQFVGRVSDKILSKLYSECRAFIQPQLEDFGITAVEAMAAGRPVIALNKGGSTETIVPGKTGIFMNYEGWEGVLEAILQLEKMSFDPVAIKQHAAKFDQQIFVDKMNSLVNRLPHVN